MKDKVLSALGCVGIILFGLASIALLAVTAFAITYGVCFAIYLVF